MDMKHQHNHVLAELKKIFATWSQATLDNSYISPAAAYKTPPLGAPSRRKHLPPSPFLTSSILDRTF
ncbi:hypothetical protein PGT21_026051 [Puccinia graminis f. sp. tritici]|uniref:Uncharacterized protein n=1 Tax=Puccinia graminis f. sp. tritici TaxID=56615 RepID=A0A5B0LYJ8_PUCGR|nr:hypothetical protein PGT21_026051 [Puccinia graminis f. sp. tritici]